MFFKREKKFEIQNMAIESKDKIKINELLRGTSFSFIKNQGQIEDEVIYYIKRGGCSIFFTKGKVVFSFLHKKENEVPSELGEFEKGSLKGLEDDAEYSRMSFAIEFINYNKEVQINGEISNAVSINYFVGNDSSKWYTGIPAYKRLVYKDIWKGIDLVFYSADDELKYDFVVNPSADINNIKLSIKGFDETNLDDNGNLVCSSKFGVFTDKKPLSYQQIDGEKKIIISNFVVNKEDENIICGFMLQDGYDQNYPLIIDPGLLYSTYLGYYEKEEGRGITVDDNENAYVVGTMSGFEGLYSELKRTGYGFQKSAMPFGSKVVTFRLSTKPDVDPFMYIIIIGGDSDDFGYGIAVDKNGSMYVTGMTTSTNFPTTGNAYQQTADTQAVPYAFVTKFMIRDAFLIIQYSTLLGGNGHDYGNGIAVDDSQNAYIVGETASLNFPTTSNAYDRTIKASVSAFVSKIDTKLWGAASLAYSTYLGGNDYSSGKGITADNIGNAYVTGITVSTDFPTTSNAYQNTNKAQIDAFISKINTNASGIGSLVYSTYLGGSNNDYGEAIAADSSGNAYITGSTSSLDFPITNNAYKRNMKTGVDTFISKINTNASGSASLTYSTYLGGDGFDFGYGIAADDAGNAYVTGTTSSTNFPTTSNAFERNKRAFNDVFISKIDTKKSGKSSLVYSTYIGGDNSDIGYGIAADSSGNTYITGETLSTDFPTTDNAVQKDDLPYDDAFLVKLKIVNEVPSRGLIAALE